MIQQTVYLSSTLISASETRDFAAFLQCDGHAVVSTWHESDALIHPRDRAPRYSCLALRLLEIGSASVLFADTREGDARTCFGEIAWAIASGVRVVRLLEPGQRHRSNLFDSHPGVLVVRSLDEARRAIGTSAPLEYSPTHDTAGGWGFEIDT